MHLCVFAEILMYVRALLISVDGCEETSPATTTNAVSDEA